MGEKDTSGKNRDSSSIYASKRKLASRPDFCTGDLEYSMGNRVGLIVMVCVVPGGCLSNREDHFLNYVVFFFKKM